MFNSFLHDITARKQTEEALARQKVELVRTNVELAAANKELEAFTYSVSPTCARPCATSVAFHRFWRKIWPRMDPAAQRSLRYIQKGVQEMGH